MATEPFGRVNERPRNARDAAARLRWYAEAAIRSELEAAATGDGGRNNALFAAACKIGGMVGGGWLHEAMAEEYLLNSARVSGYASTDGERAALATIRSGIKRGMLSPRQPPPHLDGFVFGGAAPVAVSAEVVERARKKAEELEERAAELRLEADEKLRQAGYLDRCAGDLRLHPDALDALGRRMIDMSTAEFFRLGWDRFPAEGAPETYGPQGVRPSIVLPWPSMDGEHLDAIQYRHTDSGGPKVHWHHDLHPGRLFNPEAVTAPHDRILFVVEGALAACTLHSAGITSVVALPQLRVAKEKLAPIAKRMASFDRVYWLPDGGGRAAWAEYAAMVPGDRSILSAMPMDPDDLLVSLGGDVDDFMRTVNLCVAG